RLGDVITGYVEPEAEGDEAAVAAPTGVNVEVFPAERDDDDSDDSDDDAAEVADTGPDPEEAATRFGELEKQYKKAMSAAGRHGMVHDKTNKLRKDLAECFMNFKLTQRVTDHLIRNLREAVD